MLSAISFIVGLVLATVFLYGYLSMFDWHLIWIVPYPEIVTFALVAVGVLGVFATIIPSVIESVVYWSGIPSGNPRWAYITVMALMIIFGFGSSIYAEHKALDPHYFHIVFGYSFVLGLAIVAFVIARVVHLGGRPRVNAWVIAWACASAIAVAYSIETIRPRPRK